MYILAILHVAGFAITYSFMVGDLIREREPWKYYIYSFLLAIFWPFCGYWLSAAITDTKNKQIKHWVDKYKELQDELKEYQIEDEEQAEDE